MCVVIDANTFSYVFNKSCCQYQDFEPLNNWIICGRGFLVYGGSAYKDHLRKAASYLGLFTELKRSGKAVEVNGELVDKDEKYVRELEPHPDFNDAHIVAIFRVSRCRLFCSNDSKADRFIRDQRLYHKDQKRPSIYRSRNHTHLLSDNYIVRIHNAV